MKSFFRLSASIVGLASLLPLGAAAQTVHRTNPHPILINKCNPQRNYTMAPGFVPAYYPYGAGPYWGWPSIYGPTYYQRPVASNPTLGIDYLNQTHIVMKDVEFGLIVGGNLVAEVRDVGTFSPGVEIKHEFGLSHGIFPLRGMSECVPLRITFADGSKWRNPHLPALRRQIYGKYY